MVGLIDSLTKVSQEGKSIAEFMLSVKTIIDDLAMIGHDMSDGEIVVHTLNGLTADYKEIKTIIDDLAMIEFFFSQKALYLPGLPLVFTMSGS